MKTKILFSIVISMLLFIGSLHAQQRIVTAGSSSTEIVCELGFCDNIVGTDRTSLYPEKVQSLPSIGYRTGIGAEGVISLKPDLVIFEKEYVKEEVISQLQTTGIKTLVVEHTQNIESTKTRIRAIATALKKTAEGEALIKKIEVNLKAAQQKVSTSSAHPTVLCVYARGTGSMMVAGKNTSFGLLPYAGTVNAAGELDGYKPLNTEALILANPDYILFFTTGLESIGGLEGALQIAGVNQTTAGKKKQIIAMDGVLLTNWGPRVALAVEELFYLTHPEAKK
ncbi:MAG TPA: ABC transporter substrate-binding protein [Cyclobacteriaceae bacterium]|nr:ABC transporter substrate-binding protein [Cyclobacteriaceae bacterium]